MVAGRGIFKKVGKWVVVYFGILKGISHQQEESSQIF